MILGSVIIFNYMGICQPSSVPDFWFNPSVVCEYTLCSLLYFNFVVAALESS